MMVYKKVMRLSSLGDKSIGEVIKLQANNHKTYSISFSNLTGN